LLSGSLSFLLGKIVSNTSSFSILIEIKPIVCVVSIFDTAGHCFTLEEGSEIAHHASETLRINVATAFNGLLTLLALFGAFKTIKQSLELVNVKVASGGVLITKRISHYFSGSFLNYKAWCG
jgi:hypothetical protein